MENKLHLLLKRNRNHAKISETKSKVLGGLFGLCVADALGVPVEFMSREELSQNEVTSMRGYGTYNQPPGTWSDDSSLTFCLTESLCGGLNYKDISKKFCKWMKEGYYTPYGVAFGIGKTTEGAITNMYKGVNATQCGGSNEGDNGNGSIMRVLPLAFYLFSSPVEKRFEIVHNISSLTHGHIRSKMACGMYVQIAIELLKGNNFREAYLNMQEVAIKIYSDKDEYKDELKNFTRILNEDISLYPKEEIYSTGYVIHTLEAALWCALNSKSYKETVLKAVNLGEDTDTTAAVVGGLAGMYYGYENIPKIWVQKIMKKEQIMELASKFNKVIVKR